MQDNKYNVAKTCFMQRPLVDCIITLNEQAQSVQSRQLLYKILNTCDLTEAAKSLYIGKLRASDVTLNNSLSVPHSSIFRGKNF